MFFNIILFFLSLIFTSTYALADLTSNVMISITVRESSCVVNDGGVMNVSFGNNLLESKIDGSNYLKNIDYKYKCSGSERRAMRMKIHGVESGFDQRALQTSKTDLGVVFFAKNEPLAINEWFYFDGFDNINLQAVPVKKLGAKLDEGYFSSGSTLIVDYQ
ncbi:fimbrial protein [Serratia sp. TSA_198.1]|uniref:fimbrial protein n=1 Tax=Serratia sp. TSA_198.1 TaxID=3415664 RepID=UPI004045E103